MNTEGMTLGKVLENKELTDLITALGCGMGKTFDLAKLRYGRVIILADADSDGNHIATLLLTFMYRHLPQLVANGKVYLASRRSIASTSARKPTGRWTTRTAIDC
jgi:DNA gyrase subunit B/topoisomerase-4 subunit B